jgi:hypothetical protein
VPADFSVNGIGPTGAPATYQASATDIADPTPTVSCLPASGTTFGIGTTVVQCTAADDSNNVTSRSFSIRVVGAVEQILALTDKTLLFVDLPALQPALRARLQEAAEAIVTNRPAVACRALNAYIAAVTQAPPDALTAAEKSELIADANRIKGVIACR